MESSAAGWRLLLRQIYRLLIASRIAAGATAGYSIGQRPLPLVILERRHGLISEGMAGFLGYWVGYLLVLAAALLAFFCRYKQKVLQPLQRLGIYIERLARNQGGVRHIPGGWEEMFDKITRLKP